MSSPKIQISCMSPEELPHRTNSGQVIEAVSSLTLYRDKLNGCLNIVNAKVMLPQTQLKNDIEFNSAIAQIFEILTQQGSRSVNKLITKTTDGQYKLIIYVNQLIEVLNYLIVAIEHRISLVTVNTQIGAATIVPATRTGLTGTISPTDIMDVSLPHNAEDDPPATKKNIASVLHALAIVIQIKADTREPLTSELLAEIKRSTGDLLAHLITGNNNGSGPIELMPGTEPRHIIACLNRAAKRAGFNGRSHQFTRQQQVAAPKDNS